MTDRKQEEIQIERYLEGKMSKAEQKAFREQMESDPSLREKVTDLEVFYHGFEELKVKGMVEKIKKWEEGEKVKKKVPEVSVRRLWPRWWAVVAGFLLLLATSVWYVNRPKEALQIVQINYSPIFDSNYRGANENGSILQKEINAFDSGRLDEAIAYFSQINETQESYSLARYYQAHAYFQKKAFDRAFAVFSELTYDDFIFHENAEWNQILAAIAVGKNKKEIQAYLNNIIGHPDHDYQEKAMALYALLYSG